jgi:hypothetical protein
MQLFPESSEGLMNTSVPQRNKHEVPGQTNTIEYQEVDDENNWVIDLLQVGSASWPDNQAFNQAFLHHIISIRSHDFSPTEKSLPDSSFPTPDKESLPFIIILNTTSLRRVTSTFKIL